MRNKLFFAGATLSASAFAFGMGTVVISDPDAPSTGFPAPRATTTVTATPPAPETATDGAQAANGSKGQAAAKDTKAKAAAKDTDRKGAGDKGPFQDAQDDGKVLDDFGKSVMPNAPIAVPDALLPFPGPGYTGTPTEPPTVIDSQEDADTFVENNDPAPGDVVSGANVITDPDKPWFNLPTAPVASTPVPEPVVEPTPVRDTGMVSAPRPVFR